jgi:hypothetical protein
MVTALDGAICGELGGQAGHALAHAPHPGGGDALLVAGIKLGDDLAFEPLVEGFGFGGIPSRVTAVFLAVAQSPAHFRGVGLRPRAIQLRQVKPPIDEDLHAAGSTGLPRPAWGVDPHIHPLDEPFSQEHVIVAEEDCVAAGFRLADEVNPHLDELLSRPVRRMGLAGDDKLDRAPGVG